MRNLVVQIRTVRQDLDAFEDPNYGENEEDEDEAAMNGGLIELESDEDIAEDITEDFSEHSSGEEL